MASDTHAALDAAPGDRGRRARAIVDRFERDHGPTLPAPGSDVAPRRGRHVRCTAETVSQVYTSGTLVDRDARGRAVARGQASPGGWFLRLGIVDCAHVGVSRDIAGSRADPEFLRAQRRMADPAFLSALGAGLRTAFPGRAVQSSSSTYFVPRGILFVREASVTIPLSDAERDDDSLATLLVAVGAAALRGSDTAGTTPDDDPPPSRRRGHLRLVQ